MGTVAQLSLLMTWNDKVLGNQVALELDCYNDNAF